MKRFGLWLWRIVAVAGLVVAGGMLLYVNFAPDIARGQILDALARMGVDDAVAEVRSVTPGHIQITELRLGDEAGLQIGAIGVDYKLGLTGKLDVGTVRLVGAQLTIAVRDGEIDIGPLANLKTQQTEDDEDREALPFDRLELQAASVLIHWADHEWIVPVTGTLVHEGDGECTVNAAVFVAGLAVPITGRVNFGDEADRDSIHVDLQMRLWDKPLRVAGRIDPDGESTITARLDAGDDDADRLEARYARSADGLGQLHVELATKRERLQLEAAGYSLDVQAADARVAAQVNLAERRADLTVNGNARLIDLRTPGQRHALFAPDLAADLTATLSDGALTVERRGESRLAFDRLAIGTVGVQQTTLTASDLSLRLPLFSDARPHLTATLSAPDVTVDGGGVSARGRNVQLRADAGVDPAGRFTLDSSLSFDQGSAEAPSSQLSVTGIAATVPVGVNIASTPDASLKIDTIHWQGRTYPGVTGFAAMLDGEINAGATWPLFEESPANITAALNVADGLNGEVTAVIKPFNITDPQRLGGLIEALDDYRIVGQFGLDAVVRFESGRTIPRVTISATDADLRAAGKDIVLTNVAGDITFDNLAPLTTPGGQMLRVGNGHIGGLELNRGAVAFRLERPGSIFIERADWRVGESGRFWVHAFRFDPAQPVIETNVFVDDLKLDRWLAMLTDDRVQAGGSLYGRLWMQIDTRESQPLSFGDGFLYAKGDTWIRLARREPLNDVVTLANLQNRLNETTLQLIKDALMNFEYETLQMDLQPVNEHLKLSVTISGRGRTPPHQEIGRLEVNIDGFDVLLRNRLLRAWSSPEAALGDLDRILNDRR